MSLNISAWVENARLGARHASQLLVRHTPFLNSLFFFPWRSHRTALKKFAWLWSLTTLPVIVTAFLAPIPDGAQGFFAKLLSKAGESITVAEQFVYTAAFIAPILYIIVERFDEMQDAEIPERLKEATRVFYGYRLLALIAIILLILTAVAFSAIKTSPSHFELSFLSKFLVDSSLYIYLFSLYCLYLSLLEAVKPGGYSTVDPAEAKNLGSKFADRVGVK